MKFKTLFVLFNAIILLSFAFIFFMPLPILGLEYSLSFWAQNWAIALIFVAVLASLDAYFLVHWKLFSLLEREDWPGLRKLLEDELVRKGALDYQKSKIFLNACLIGQNPGRINQLRASYVEKKVKILPRLVLGLGLPLVLEGRSEAIEEFFGPWSHDRRTGADGPWIRWCLAFGRLVGQNVEGARPLLEEGAKDRRQPLLQLLSLYLLNNLRHTDDAVALLVDTERASLAARLTPKEWANHIDGLKERVLLVLFLEKLIAEARGWLQTPPEGASA